MPFWQLFYHLVWTTKGRQPLLTSTVEPIIYGFIRTKVIKLGGTIFALNGTFDHTHAVVSIPPSLAISNFVGQLKGVSSALYNQGISNQPKFEWQPEYGAFSFDRKRLPNLISYVERQKYHHAENTTIPILERIDDHGVQLLKETSTGYAADMQSWIDEMRSLEEFPG